MSRENPGAQIQAPKTRMHEVPVKCTSSEISEKKTATYYEIGLTIENRNVLSMVTRTLSMQIQNHATLLHRPKHRIKNFIVKNPRTRVGRDTSRIRLDSHNSLSLRSLDDCWSNLLMKIQRHQIVDTWILLLQALLIRHSIRGRSERWDQVRHGLNLRIRIICERP